MGRHRGIDGVLNDIGGTMLTFGLACLLLLVVLAAYFFVKGVCLVAEAWHADPTNRALRISLAVLLALALLTALLPIVFPLALLSFIWLVGVARVVQLQHTGTMERAWDRGAFLGDVLTRSWW